MKFDKELINTVADALIDEAEAQGIPFSFDGDPYDRVISDGNWYWSMRGFAQRALEVMASNYGKT